MTDKRGNIKVDVSLLKNWLENHYIVYSRDLVKINGAQFGLIFSVSISQNFVVSLGTDILYSGKNMSRAIKVFNLPVEDINRLWIDMTDTNKSDD